MSSRPPIPIPLDALERLAKSSPEAVVRLVDEGIVPPADVVFAAHVLSTVQGPRAEAALAHLLSHPSTGFGLTRDEVFVGPAARGGDDGVHDDEIDRLLESRP